MGHTPLARPVGGGVCLVVLLLTGCSLTPGKGFTLFPENNRLIDSAKAMRDAATEPAPLPRELNKRALPPYTVEPGDALLVQPADLDSQVRLPADQPILPDGTINLGRYGQLVVAGKTVPEIESAIRSAVEAQTKNVGPITVRIVSRQSKVYYVLGDVNAPGEFQLSGRETVLDALMAAGGLTDRASRGNIILSRPTPPQGCRVVLPICYDQIVQDGDTSTNYQIMPGDRIYVPSRTFWEQITPPSHKKECPVCGGMQVPCPVGSISCGGPAHDAIDNPPVLPSPSSPAALGAPVPKRTPVSPEPGPRIEP